MVDESGKPIRGAVVDVTVLGSASARRTVAKIQTDETGHFALMILDGHRHEVSTIVRTDPTQIVAASVTLDPDASNVTLVIRR